MENTENQTLAPEGAEPRQSRRSRSLDSRDSDNRASQERPPIVFGNISRYNLDPSILADKRYRFSWVPYMVNNEEIHQYYDNAVRRGWEAVEATDYSQARRVFKKDPLRNRADEEEYMKVGGQICMRRKEEICKDEDKYFSEENAHRDKLVDLHKDTTPGGTRITGYSRTRSSRPDV